MARGLDGAPGERRSAARLRAAETSWSVRAVLRPGQEVTLLDVSRASLRLAAPIPLRPGRRVELQLRREDGRHQAAGLIVWCQLALLAPATYHAAIALDDPLPAG